MGACGECGAESYWLPTYVHKKERERQAGQHCYLKTLIWCLSLQVTLVRYRARSRSGTRRAAALGWNPPACRVARDSSRSSSAELGVIGRTWEMHLPSAPRTPAGPQAAEGAQTPEERFLPMCKAQISDDRAGESL